LRPEARRLLDSGLPVAASARRPFHWAIEFPEILVDGDGFDAVIGNPPFMGGKRITGALGTSYRDYLVGYIAGGQRGHADICAYFFLRAWGLLRRTGQCALLATNTIAQGDTREVGLDRLAAQGAVIPRAVASRKWPGQANLEVAEVWLRKGEWAGPFMLEDKPVAGITPQLTPPGGISGAPFRLKANEGKSFIGSYVLGMGFVLTPEEAERLKAKDPRNADVVFPYLNGEDLNSRPDQSPSRWVINFRNWPLRREVARQWKDLDEGEQQDMLRSGAVTFDYPEPVAADYPDCLKIIEDRVKPERTRLDTNGRFSLRYPLYLRWWQYADKRPELYATIAGMPRFMVRARVTSYNCIAFANAGWICSEQTVAFSSANCGTLALLQSTMHSDWFARFGSTLETRLRYTPSDCFETFPLPASLDRLEDIGRRYYAHRQRIMQFSGKGLTAAYNRFHDRHETADDIEQLRDLHMEMDRAVALAYCWDDLDLGHGFHQTRQGERFTISDAARRTILDRLLQLNHERHAAEVAAGLFDEKKPKSRRSRKGREKDAPANGSLF
ncbi:MAG: type IIL restriction-modification enzyme MmeI, partial [Bryobacteraceae bacterium]